MQWHWALQVHAQQLFMVRLLREHEKANTGADLIDQALLVDAYGCAKSRIAFAGNIHGMLGRNFGEKGFRRLMGFEFQF